MDHLKKENVLALANELLSLYYAKRDTEAILRYMEENIYWIGTGKEEVCCSLTEAKTALMAELAEYEGSFDVSDTAFVYIPLENPCCVICGELTAKPADHSLSEENVRISAVLQQTEAGPKLAHIHFSHADAVQEEGAYFVKETAKSDNRSLRKELSLRERQLANLTKNIPGGAHQCANDSHWTLLSMSDGFLSMFGYNKEEIESLFNNRFINMVYAEDREKMLKTASAQLQKGNNIELEYRVQCKDGSLIWVLDKGRMIEDGDGNDCFYCLLIDISKRKRQEEELRLSLERHKVIMDQATDIIFEWDIAKDTLEFSSNWKKKFGYDPVNIDISGKIPFSANIHPEDISAFLKLMEDARVGVSYGEAEFRIRDCKGRFYWCRIRATAQYDSAKRPVKAVGVIVDIDAEKKQKQDLIALAQHDTLTGIYNKAAINALVEQRIQETNAEGYQALFMIDIDHFKMVNDTYGHLCGDSVLSDVAAVLKGTTRKSDLVGRIGGDEFLVYLPQVADEAAAYKKAEGFLEGLACIRPEATAPPITCSIGAVILSHNKTPYQTMYEYADKALYQRKNSGRNGVSFWDTSAEEIGFAVSAVGNTIVSDEGNVADEWLAQYAFRTLYEAKDIEAALNRLLEIIGRSYDVSRAYIFESSSDGSCCSNTFEWCSDGIPSQIEKLQNIAYVDDLDNYPQNFNEQGVFYCENVKNLHPDVYEIAKSQGIYSMLQCAMLDEGEFVGYVGFDECRENRTWSQRQIAAFKLTADVLSIFLIKLRQKQRIKMKK